jgi:energy-coupling factor transporter transmembrane protein EcfT
MGLLIFAAAVAAVEWFALRRPPWIAARMLAVAAAGLAASRLVPWTRAARWGLGRKFLRPIALYFLVLGHFLRIFREEIQSLFSAWKLAAGRRRGAAAWRSLACATASLFPRVLRRAERFYAAMLVKGMAG